MRRALLVFLLACSSACAAHTSKPHAVPTPARYTFSEDLPDGTRICVPRTPFSGDVNCMPLEELRQWLRRRGYVKFAPDNPPRVPIAVDADDRAFPGPGPFRGEP